MLKVADRFPFLCPGRRRRQVRQPVRKHFRLPNTGTLLLWPIVTETQTQLICNLTIRIQSDHSHAAPFQVYYVGFRAYKSSPILNALVQFPCLQASLITHNSLQYLEWNPA